MKILYFSPHPTINMAAPSGPGTHIREIISGFESQGHHVVRFIAGGESLVKGEANIQFRKRSWKKFIPSIIWETLRDIQMIRADITLEKELTAIISREKPDLIYERSCFGLGAGRRAAKASNIRYVVEMNAPYPEEKSQMQGKSLLAFIGRRHEKEQVNGAYKTIVVSTAMKDYLIQKTGVAEHKVVVCANAVNLSKINTAEQTVSAIRQEFNLRKEHTIIGFVGSIFPYHGVDLMIEAFRALEKEQPTARMLIVGDGEILARLKEVVIAHGLNEKITFTGNVPHSEIFNYISLMDITVMARSNWYGSPVKIFEYGAMGKAIIAPNVIPVQDVMVHGEDGLLIEDTTNDLLGALHFMLRNPAERERMALQFQHKVMTKHTWETVAKQTLAACQ
jgi:glycosyltransferase involved in cell wall biosynthesis